MPSEEAQDSSPLAPWEELVTEAVGTTIEFWGFKRNHGRLWALLFLRDVSMPARELGEALTLSKGALSMLTRELEHWNVVRRVRGPRDATWRFEANTNLMRMIRRVLEVREAEVVARVHTNLSEAEEAAEAGGASEEVIQRIRQMRRLSELFEKAIALFLQTARLDLRGLIGVLAGRVAK